MTTCWACETELRPEWKFCIHCGVPVEAESAAERQGSASGPPLAMFGGIVAGIGGAVLVVAIVLLLVLQ